MSEIKVIDNFLPENEYKNILNQIINIDFPWYIHPHSDFENDDNPQLTHTLYKEKSPNSEYLNVFNPIFVKLNAMMFYSVRLIGTRPFDSNSSNIYHKDVYGFNNKKIPMKTAVWYLNTTDGGTQFKDTGEIIEGVGNRMVVFDTELEHRTIKHKTGNMFRYVLNMNYLELENV